MALGLILFTQIFINKITQDLWAIFKIIYNRKIDHHRICYCQFYVM
jgi:hypothetical protein